ncbi:MAG: hypothetical protein ACPG2Y_02935, partial [Acholeplasmataceae bacterium]
WTDSVINYQDIFRSSDWSVKKIVHFRYHLHSQSFAMGFTNNNNQCIMKTNNNYIFKFKDAYSFQYCDYDEILLAKGVLFPIIKAKRPFNWINDKFCSMDQIHDQQRISAWYFLTNLIEPVFLLHRCVRLTDVLDTLPKNSDDIKNWHNLGSKLFYRQLSINLHNLWIAKQQDKEQLHEMRMPCGPVYRCKAHNFSRCTQCRHTDCEYDPKLWNVSWKCNKNFSKHYYIFDAKNGLNMTLMETVIRDSDVFYQ